MLLEQNAKQFDSHGGMMSKRMADIMIGVNRIAKCMSGQVL